MTLTEKQIQDYKKAGDIAKQVTKFAKELIKPDMPLIEIAQKIESKIIELGGQIAFPVNLSINEIAAHYTPSLHDETKATGLLKIDLGVHINGFIADTAFSLDLTSDKKYKELIEASEAALEKALKIAKQGTTLTEIGKTIQDTITDLGFSPIRNLSGHELGEHLIHAGITIPNYENKNETPLEPGAYAIEPFATTGEGVVKDGGPSGIYRFEKMTAIRDPLARKIIEHVVETYESLPFSQRVIEKKFGTKALFSLRLLEQAGILHNYPQLIEKSKAPVSQAEHTIIISKDKTEITTR